jgi:hypothetical protein
MSCYEMIPGCALRCGPKALELDAARKVGAFRQPQQQTSPFVRDDSRGLGPGQVGSAEIAADNCLTGLKHVLGNHQSLTLSGRVTSPRRESSRCPTIKNGRPRDSDGRGLGDR